MTENKKPEWFAIAEEDGPTALQKRSKGLPLLAILSASLILGFGGIVSQLQQPSSATTSQIELAQPTATTSAATSKLKNPSIAQLPKNGENEHEDDYEDEDDD
jgi:hypothetical protein